MYIAALTSNAWQGKRYVNNGSLPGEPGRQLLTSDRAEAYRFERRSAAGAEARETARDEGVLQEAGPSDVCWNVEEA